MSERFRAQRMAGLVQSDIRRLTIECEWVGGINLGQGVCDLPTHPLVKQGAIEAIEAGRATYTHAMGLIELRKAIAGKLKSFNRVEYAPETEVCITAGSSGAFSAAVFSTLDSGDEAVLIEPFYGYHLNTLLLAGIKPRFGRIDLSTMTLDRDSISAAISDKTRAIILCTPGNPSGMVFSTDDLEWLGSLAQAHDLLVLADEIYEYIVYDGREHISIASLEGLRERVLTIGGYSKTFSITGWRIGYLAGPAELISRAAVVCDLLYVCPPHPLQLGVLKGLEAVTEYYERMRSDYQAGRDSICAALEAAGFRVYRPQGSYYVMAEFSAQGWPDSRTAARELLERAKVAAIPGAAFFEPGSARGEKMLRFCFAKPPEVLAEACNRLGGLGK
ncbi:MAG: pyridoxal phosphate-dependent aminotransferase [Nitrospira sp.]|nr:pyridoxal phosphate-dependent aminotransferase [Nitrospira sp.]